MKSLARGSIFIEILFCASFARRSRYFADQPPAPVRATDEGGPAPQLEVLEGGAQELWIGPRLTDRVDHAERRAGGNDFLESFAERKERRVHVTPPVVRHRAPRSLEVSALRRAECRLPDKGRDSRTH